MHPRLSPALALLLIALLAGCAGPRSFSRGTLAPLPDAFRCAVGQLQALGYDLALVDSVGGVAQGQREITGLREAARRGASAATGVVTGGLAGGRLDRFDEITVSVFTRNYPYGNTLEATAGLLTLTDDTREQSEPTDDARRDARALIQRCATG